MPYSGASDSSLPSNVKKMSTSDRKRWIKIFNSVYKGCSDGKKECEKKAFKAANGVIGKGKEKGRMAINRFTLEVMEEDKNIIERLFGLFNISGKLKPVEDKKKKKSKKRAVSFPNLYWMVSSALREKIKGSDDIEGSYWDYELSNVLWDTNGLYAVVNHRGQLLRSNITINNGGGSLTMGDFQQVVENHTPASSNERSSYTIFRQKDGQYRILMRAATAILNKDNEIDSTELFDNMIKRAEETGIFPTIDYYHFGKYNEKFEIGQIDSLARSGVVYIASGIIDENSLLGRKVINAFEKDPKKWGCSIEYYPLDGEKEAINVDNDLEVDVYRDGINTRIAVLQVNEACNWFTGIVPNKERGMSNLTNEQIVEKFRLVFDDEDELADFLKDTGMINDEVERNKLVYRKVDNEGNPVKEDGDGNEDGDDQGLEIEIDDTIIDLISEKVVERLSAENDGDDDDKLDKLVESITALTGKVEGLLERHNETVERVGKLEKKQTLTQDLIDDSPDHINENRTKKVTYRPSVDRQVDQGQEEENFSEIAKENLDIPGRPY